MKKIICILIITILSFTLFAGCNESNDDLLDIESHFLNVKTYGIAEVKVGNVATGETLVGHEEVAPFTKMKLTPTFKNGEELGYWYMPSGVDVYEENGEYYFEMPNYDCEISIKTKKIGEERVQKEHRFEVVFINVGVPMHPDLNDYYNYKDKISVGGIRSTAEEFNILNITASDGKKYKINDITMPDYDLIITISYEKSK